MADVSMPQLGETVTEGTITQWFKAVGDSVEVDEPLFEVSTDKVDSEVPSPASGVLQEILVPEGETVDVGTKLAVLGDGDGSTPAPAADDEAPAEAKPRGRGGEERTKHRPRNRRPSPSRRHPPRSRTRPKRSRSPSRSPRTRLPPRPVAARAGSARRWSAA